MPNCIDHFGGGVCGFWNKETKKCKKKILEMDDITCIIKDYLVFSVEEDKDDTKEQSPTSDAKGREI